VKRWWRFIRERFEPLSHLLMIGCFYSANIALLKAIVFSTEPLEFFKLAIGLAVTVLFFFHLRLFDEIKDYATDQEVNRDRPLPRGLIRMSEFKAVLWSVLVLELVLTSLLGWHITAAFLIPWFYSILMYREFFIGGWLRPKMEAYAISHTFVSALLALFFASLVGNVPVAFLPIAVIWVALNNWMIFNTFEFARKTFGRDEERSHVESYSKRWRPVGAALWVGFFVLMSLALLYRLNDLGGWGLDFKIGVAATTSAVLLAGILYSAQPSIRAAKVFRSVASLYLIAINLVIVFL